MYKFQNKTGSVGYDISYGQDRGFGIFDENSSRLIYQRALSSNLLDVMRAYGLKIDEYSKKTICPFPSHSEDSASFYFYKDTNSFFCFGCKRGGSVIDFVSIIEGISKFDAANKILSDFECNEKITIQKDDYKKKQSILFTISSILREFIMSNLDDENAFQFFEDTSKTFDELYSKHKLETNALEFLLKKMQERLLKYNANSDIR